MTALWSPQWWEETLPSWLEILEDISWDIMTVIKHCLKPWSIIDELRKDFSNSEELADNIRLALRNNLQQVVPGTRFASLEWSSKQAEVLNLISYAMFHALTFAKREEKIHNGFWRWIIFRGKMYNLPLTDEQITRIIQSLEKEVENNIASPWIWDALWKSWDKDEVVSKMTEVSALVFSEMIKSFRDEFGKWPMTSAQLISVLEKSSFWSKFWNIVFRMFKGWLLAGSGILMTIWLQWQIITRLKKAALTPDDPLNSALRAVLEYEGSFEMIAWLLSWAYSTTVAGLTVMSVKHLWATIQERKKAHRRGQPYSLGKLLLYNTQTLALLWLVWSTIYFEVGWLQWKIAYPYQLADHTNRVASAIDQALKWWAWSLIEKARAEYLGVWERVKAATALVVKNEAWRTAPWPYSVWEWWPIQGKAILTNPTLAWSTSEATIATIIAKGEAALKLIGTPWFNEKYTLPTAKVAGWADSFDAFISLMRAKNPFAKLKDKKWVTAWEIELARKAYLTEIEKIRWLLTELNWNTWKRVQVIIDFLNEMQASADIRYGGNRKITIDGKIQEIDLKPLLAALNIPLPKLDGMTSDELWTFLKTLENKPNWLTTLELNTIQMLIWLRVWWLEWLAFVSLLLSMFLTARKLNKKWQTLEEKRRELEWQIESFVQVIYSRFNSDSWKRVFQTHWKQDLPITLTRDEARYIVYSFLCEYSPELNKYLFAGGYNLKFVAKKMRIWGKFSSILPGFIKDLAKVDTRSWSERYVDALETALVWLSKEANKEWWIGISNSKLQWILNAFLWDFTDPSNWTVWIYDAKQWVEPAKWTEAKKRNGAIRDWVWSQTWSIYETLIAVKRLTLDHGHKLHAANQKEIHDIYNFLKDSVVPSLKEFHDEILVKFLETSEWDHPQRNGVLALQSSINGLLREINKISIDEIQLAAIQGMEKQALDFIETIQRYNSSDVIRSNAEL